MESLIEFFKILSADEHSEARRKTFFAFKRYDGRELNAFHGKDFETRIAMVRADMDQMGTLFHHNLIPKKVFLEAYWNTVLLCWKALRNNIEEELIRRGYPTYMKYFEELKDEAKSYWRSYHPEVKHLKVY